jgi:hypothetical protein
MSSSIVAVAIASVGVLGTLAGAAVNQLLSTRAPRPFQDRFEGLDHDSRLRCCDLVMSGRAGQGM